MSTEEGAPSDPGWDDLTPEQKQRLLQLASGGVTRRDVLAGGGALAVGGLLGGGASQALTEPAAASHGAGSVGEPGNPIDTAYVTSINGDGDNVGVSPGFGSVSFTGQTHGADVTDAFETKEISPNVTDVGAAVNTAISELGADGGVIKLPYAPSGGAINTKVDFSTGVNGQQQDTPLVFVGHGNPGFDQRGGTLLDATNLADHVFQYDGDNRENIHFRDFAIQNVAATKDAFNLGAVNNFWHRNSSIVNVGVFGSGRWGINSRGGFGSTIRNCYVGNGVDRAYRFDDANSINVENIIARFCGSESAPVQIVSSNGGSFQDLYIESNPGAALELNGGQSFELDAYFEGNNRSGNAANEFIIQTGDPVHCTLGPIYWAGAFNAFSGPRASFSGGRYNEMVGWGGNRVDLTATGVGGHLYQRCFLGTLDTTGATNGSTYIENNITTANRNAGATIVSGD